VITGLVHPYVQAIVTRHVVSHMACCMAHLMGRTVWCPIGYPCGVPAGNTCGDTAVCSFVEAGFSQLVTIDTLVVCNPQNMRSS
jgi:hypothetical protein